VDNPFCIHSKWSYWYVSLEKNESLDDLVKDCLKKLEISVLSDWDVLIFLYRHRASLATVEQIARLLGHPAKTVVSALERLDSQRLVRRSRSSQGVRFYQFIFPEGQLGPQSCFRRLIGVADNRSVRLTLLKHLGLSTALPVVAEETVVTDLV
jgi:hypothetical protein